MSSGNSKQDFVKGIEMVNENLDLDKDSNGQINSNKGQQ